MSSMTKQYQRGTETCRVFLFWFMSFGLMEYSNTLTGSRISQVLFAEPGLNVALDQPVLRQVFTFWLWIWSLSGWMTSLKSWLKSTEQLTNRVQEIEKVTA